MKWGVLGCGVIGDRRSAQLPVGAKLVACFDVNAERAASLAAKHGAVAKASLESFLATPDLEAVIIAAINSELTNLANAALAKGLHILVEKPAARSADELLDIKNPFGRVVKIGFNHRFHPAFEKLKAETASRPNDPIMFVRAQYGNGARLGFEREWRASAELGGGGELLDQGVHVLDLAGVLIPDLKVVSGFVKTHYWDMSVDDNAWAILSSPKTGATFSMHVSSSEWKNEFRFEVYTRSRKYQWLGLGRSYGAETLLIHTMSKEMGPPQTEEIRFAPEDQSWLRENENFQQAILERKAVNGGYDDAVRTLRLVEAIYRSSRALQPETNHPQWWGA